MLTAPKVEHRDAQPYVAIRTPVMLKELSKVIPKLHKEVFAWLKKRNITPAGPPFIRWNVIDMAATCDVELGVPVASAVQGDDRVTAGVLPAGQYASLVYSGVRNGIKGNKALLDWLASEGLVLDRWDTAQGDAFGGRYESFLTDPADEPKKGNWDTEVAIRLADEKPQ